MKSIKKTLCLFLTILTMVSAITPVMANGDIKVKIDGQQIAFDVPPQLINDRTMVPLRVIFEALGATVDWDNDTQTVTSTKDNTTISLTINNPTMYVNGLAVTLDSPACLVNSRTLVPVRAISEAFGTTVDWEGDTQTVIITTTSSTGVNQYYDDITANINQITGFIKQGLYLEAIQECKNAKEWHLLSPEDIEKINALENEAQSKYDAYYFYPTDVISEKVPRFDAVVGGSFDYQKESTMADIYSKTSPDYWYNADFDKAAAYQKILKQYGWEQDGFTDFNYETKIVNNTVKQVARSFNVWFEKDNIKLQFYYSYKTGRVCISYHIY